MFLGTKTLAVGVTCLQLDTNRSPAARRALFLSTGTCHGIRDGLTSATTSGLGEVGLLVGLLDLLFDLLLDLLLVGDEQQDDRAENDESSSLSMASQARVILTTLTEPIK